MKLDQVKLSLAVEVISEGMELTDATAFAAAAVLVSGNKGPIDFREVRRAAVEYLVGTIMALTKRVAELEERPAQIIKYEERGLGP